MKKGLLIFIVICVAIYFFGGGDKEGEKETVQVEQTTQTEQTGQTTTSSARTNKNEVVDSL